jgi:hypothetical protein
MNQVHKLWLTALLLLADCTKTHDVLTPDQPPLDTLITEFPPALTRDLTARFSFVSTRDPTTFTCRFDTTAIDCPGTTVILNRIGDGAHEFSVTARFQGIDDATPATYRWTVDTTPPFPPRTSVEPQGPANDNAPVLSIYAEALATVRIYQGGCGGTVVAERVVQQATGMIRYTASVPDDSSTLFAADAVDAAGNVSECASAYTPYVEDSTAPVVTFTVAPPHSWSGSFIPSLFTVSSNEDATPMCSVDGAAISCRLDEVTTLDLESLRPGRHILRVEAIDGAGNVGSLEWGIDRRQYGQVTNLGFDFAGVSPDLPPGIFLRYFVASTSLSPRILLYTGGATAEELHNLERALAFRGTMVSSRFDDPGQLADLLRNADVLIIPDQNVTAGAPALAALLERWRNVVPVWVKMGGQVVVLSGKTPDGAISGTFTLLSGWGLLDTSQGVVPASGLSVSPVLEGITASFYDVWTSPDSAVAFVPAGDSAGLGHVGAATDGGYLVYSRRFATVVDFEEGDLEPWPWAPWAVAAGAGSAGTLVVGPDSPFALRGPGAAAWTSATQFSGLSYGRVHLRVFLDAADGAASLDLGSSPYRAEIRGTSAGPCRLRLIAGADVEEATLPACSGPLELVLSSVNSTSVRAAAYGPSGPALAALTSPDGPVVVDTTPVLRLEGAVVVDDLAVGELFQ